MRTILLTVMGLMTIAGCGSATTETGYSPRKLGMTNPQRKGLYAPRYTPEAAQAEADREAETKSRRPGQFAF